MNNDLYLYYVLVAYGSAFSIYGGLLLFWWRRKQTLQRRLQELPTIRGQLNQEKQR